MDRVHLALRPGTDPEGRSGDGPFPGWKGQLFLGRKVSGDRLGLPLGPACQGVGGWQLHHRHLPALRAGLLRLYGLDFLQHHRRPVYSGPGWRGHRPALLLYPISQVQAEPGDLAFYADDSHVGIVVGRRENGKLLVCHYSGGQDNVVVTEFAASGFANLGRPNLF